VIQIESSSNPGVLLNAGAADEPQVAYLMAEVRKLLEQQRATQQYHCVNLHCKWALDSTLSGDATQDILKYFDAANTHLKTGLKLHQLPSHQRTEIDNISQMKHFENELEAFLKAKGLSRSVATGSGGTGKFGDWQNHDW
jgi:hypothetical protein